MTEKPLQALETFLFANKEEMMIHSKPKQPISCD